MTPTALGAKAREAQARQVRRQQLQLGLHPETRLNSEARGCVVQDEEFRGLRSGRRAVAAASGSESPQAPAPGSNGVVRS